MQGVPSSVSKLGPRYVDFWAWLSRHHCQCSQVGVHVCEHVSVAARDKFRIFTSLEDLLGGASLVPSHCRHSGRKGGAPSAQRLVKDQAVQCKLSQRSHTAEKSCQTEDCTKVDLTTEISGVQQLSGSQKRRLRRKKLKVALRNCPADLYSTLV